MSSSIHDNSTSRSSGTITKIDPSMQKTIDTIRDVAKNMRDTSARIRDVVQAIHQSGAIDELVTAVHEAVIAARDTTKEINEVEFCLSGDQKSPNYRMCIRITLLDMILVNRL